ncbi:SDR family NAD(P)-dependent oxidoreductase [Kaistella jeonii]|uniref:Oxidoreductase n=1 Tax=Kaistella jeonii TaxID=266749 RepID=A0A0C1F9Y6_9FLAO|nr:SDR family oxidoreductase [Kaistella jeonii]KIA88703.1 oxidoreductase [Kaistella jeonii]SFC10478.1 NAD(P)-dependent dehydrogenase, short-chain alcohol dehydrogenase family [Kaistella jeonii]VEI95281.1 3-oxoacyl-[acyl-carrier-protein] reductase FabG [Kaistella jeonii]
MKNILIIGAGRGIGLKTAQLLKEENLYTISRNLTPELESLGTQFFQFDVAKDDLSELSLPDQLHGVVFCPGSINLKPFNRLTEEDFLADFHQNFLGAVRVIQKCLPILKKSGGASIVLFSTVAAKVGMPFHTSIAASKGAIESFARSLASELAAAKIRVNVIAPSLSDTSLAAMLLSTEEKREASAKRHPLQRIGSTEDSAQLVEFLLSDKSSWITGQVIGVDGGLGNIKL